ncbi:MAG TPA: sialidase [Thermoanaerobaculia bacterium]|nr:sialidase [Thermoanaerobaculia bacterium]
MNVLFLLAALLAAPAPAAKPMTVDEVVAKAIEAKGGAAKITAIQSIRATGKAIFGGGNFSIEAAFGLLIKRPGMIRSETTLQGLTAVEAYDGTEGWTVQPFQGRRDPQKTSAEDLKSVAQEADLEGPLVRWKEKGHRVEYLGTEDVDGTAAHKLRVNLKDGDVEYVYLDPDYFLEIRNVTVSKVRGAEQITETDLGSYEQVAGVWMPFSIESGRPGRPRASRTTFDRVEVNVTADDALFHFPAAGTPVVRAIAAGPQAEPAAAAAKPPALPAGRAPGFDSGVISGLNARNIGSATMSGRIASVAARNEGGKTTIFVGAASGGVWKSADGGTTFKPVFDKESVQSIGAVTIDPSNPKTVWVGTGESWMRNSVSVGDGIYKSTDGGETWKNMGLKDSEHVIRILVHPSSSDTVYACVPGRLWSDGAERGVYKTTDGGKTWTQVLKGPNLSTGCASLAMDAKNPDVLFAGLWDFRRKGWTFRSGGEGPEAPSASALMRTEDGGKTWTDVAAAKEAGLPGKPWGRVEVAVAPSDPKIVYALVECRDSALYRSADGGKTWQARDKSQGMVWRPFYFGRLIVDPTNAERLFKPGLTLTVSEDGGRSFSGSGGGSHGDWHDVWIDPDNTKRMIGGDDGGFWLSYDGGSRWWKGNNLPVSQFYHVAVDMRDPYQVYGGLQDNSSWVGDSSYPGGITNGRWDNLYGGDGFWTVPDATDADAVYAESQGGNVGRVNTRTHAARDIQPKADYKEKLRFNWNTPISSSPNQKGTIYIGSQFLFRSRDQGDTWERISPDLSTNDAEKQKQEQSGGVTVDNSSAEEHTTIYSISESPKDGNLVWAGTDDGNLQLTRDGGKTWTNVAANVPGLAKASWVSWVEAGRFDPAVAYAAFDRHTFGDMTPYVYRTADYGKTWKRIVSPEQGVRGYAHCVKEDTVKPSLLFVGTEFGLWISPDGGARWAEFKGADFPSVAVREIQVHPRDNDLVLATHGRGIWIVDDLTPLRDVTDEVLSREAAFLPGRPLQQRMPAQGGWPEGDASFTGQNPPAGAVITYYQRSRHLFGPIKIEILDAEGKLVDTITASKRRGLNRVYWPMRVKPPRVPRAATLAFGSSQGPRVVPGTYTVRLTKGGQTTETKLEIGIDRRAPYSAADRKAQFDAVMKAHALFGEMSALVDRIEQARAAAGQRAKAAGSDAQAAKAAADALAKLDEIKKKIVATKEGGAITGEERIREHLDDVYGAMMRWEGKPASYQVARVEALRRELSDVAKEFETLAAELPRPPASAGVAPR